MKVCIKIREIGKSAIMRTVYDACIELEDDTMNLLFKQFSPSHFYYTMHPRYNIVLDKTVLLTI